MTEPHPMDPGDPMTVKTTISYDDYLKLRGLAALSDDHRKAMQAIEHAIAGIVGVAPGDGEGYFGLVSDEIYSLDGFSVGALLERLKITVEPEAA